MQAEPHTAQERLAIFADLREKGSVILSRQPVSSYRPSPPPKVIWWSWLQGEDKAPEICKVCLRSVRKYFSDWQINIVSLENLDSFVKLPGFVKEKFVRGVISPAHFSDVLRMCLLVEHGGLWVDATLLCTGLERIGGALRAPLFFYAHDFNRDPTMLGSNWLFAAQKQHPILQGTRDLLFWFWQQHSTLPDYYLFHLLFHVAALHRPELLKMVPMVSNVPPHLMQRELFAPFSPSRLEEFKTLSDFHKLTWHIPDQPHHFPNSLYEYLLSQ